MKLFYESATESRRFDEYGNDNMSHEESAASENPRKWRPLNARQRRVVGVLVEKAKTTPSGYPMTLKALTTGCNQKSNRSPQMDLTVLQVEETLDELREMGAIAEVQGDGRVPKYRHYIYEWLDVDKQEIAVMVELLLREEQTVGDLRGRASRMEQIGSLAELKPILDSLMEKGLLLELTPEGRGQVVTHRLYPERELEALQTAFKNRPPETSEAEPRASSPRSSTGDVALRQDVANLREEVDQLHGALADLREQLREVKELLQ